MTIAADIRHFANLARAHFANGLKGTAKYTAMVAGHKAAEMASATDNRAINPFDASEPELQVWAELGMAATDLAESSAPQPVVTSAVKPSKAWRGATHAAHSVRED